MKLPCMTAPRTLVGFVLAAVFFSGGCIFAPPTYGRRGVVTPNDTQYRLYLDECRRRQAVLDRACRDWGEPAAIQIGSSGGYFVWEGRKEWVYLKSFKALIRTDAPPRLLARHANPNLPPDDRQLRAAGRNASATPGLQLVFPPSSSQLRAAGRNASATAAQSPVKPLYSVENFERLADNQFAYAFRLKLNPEANVDISSFATIREEMRRSIIADYSATYGAKMGDTRVDFSKFALSDGVIEGWAEVMRIGVKSLSYDDRTHKGVIAVSIGAHSFEDARNWIRKNIETLARDKNVALTTGHIPSEAHFYLHNERVVDGNVLEIEFETE